MSQWFTNISDALVQKLMPIGNSNKNSKTYSTIQNTLLTIAQSSHNAVYFIYLKKKKYNIECHN